MRQPTKHHGSDWVRVLDELVITTFEHEKEIKAVIIGQLAEDGLDNIHFIIVRPQNLQALIDRLAAFLPVPAPTTTA
jgi:hypothetical protein